MKKTLIILSLILLTSCASSVSIEECILNEPNGFWMGLWHGIIMPFSFIASLFNDSIAMYSINNNGGWYDFGFLLGASSILGGGGSASKS